ncbi:MAG: RNA polymerase sigma factor [Phycisphaerales bacterium]
MSTRGTSSWKLADASAAAGVSDLAALERYATSGDPRAFEILAVRYRDMVLGTCLRTLSSMADAEDATQETFLKLARHAREIRSNAAAWLHATAVRTSLDALRRRTSQRRAVERSAADRVAMERTAARAESPADEPTWRQMQPVVDAALASLSDADRSLIVERFLAGRPQADMAAEAGVSKGTMSRRIDAALERLRGRRIFLHLPPDESKNFHGGTLMALRPFKGHPADTGVKHSSAGNHELLAGNWIPMPELDLTIDGDAINMGQGDWTRESLRIISWEKTDAFARVEVICKGAADRTMIGKRFKLLARLADDGSITLTHHTLASGKNTQWPEGFDEPFLSADPEGSVAPRAGLRTLLFRPGAQP